MRYFCVCKNMAGAWVHIMIARVCKSMSKPPNLWKRKPSVLSISFQSDFTFIDFLILTFLSLDIRMTALSLWQKESKILFIHSFIHYSSSSYILVSTTFLVLRYNGENDP